MDMSKVQDQAQRAMRMGSPDCPVCESNHWEFGRIYDPEKLKYSGPSDPPKPENYECVCNKCGYIVCFKIANLMKWDLADVALD
ncbi:MAG: hypothetical protein IH944_02265 [Armatimonadetes bacterium]|nr:hypothetical protein [Armatimonadota bacterium]